MFQLVSRRIVELIPTLLVVTAVLFLLLSYLPGSPALSALGEAATDADIAAVERELGLDRPLVERYVSWLVDVLQGELGRSIRTGEPVASMLLERAPVTLELTFLAVALAVVIGVPLGVVGARNRNTWVDSTVTTLGLIFLAVPNFVLGLLLIILFSLRLSILPPSGFVPISLDPIENLRLMILPVLCVGLSVTAIVLRQTRATMIQTISQDFVRTARAKGATGRRAIFCHALPNAIAPVVTVVGLQVGALLGGAVVTESVFSLPGIGKMMIDGILNRDMPVVQGAIIMIVGFVVLTNLLVDVLYTVIDPRAK